MKITDQTQAKQLVESFLSRYDQSYIDLLYHAALPILLTPELLHYIRNGFVGEVKWIAEVDLLLSNLCNKVGYELYAIDTDVRAYLIKEMEKDSRFGQKRMEEVASLLIKYLRYLSKNNSISQFQLKHQKWGALVYLEDKYKEEVANEIAETFSKYLEPIMVNSKVEIDLSMVNKDELYQLALITKNFAPKLTKYPELIKCAKTVSSLLEKPVNSSGQSHDLIKTLRKVGKKVKDFSPNKQVKKVAFINLDTKLSFLPALAQLANQVQDYYHFQVADISIANEKFVRKSSFASDTPQTFLPDLVEYVQDLPQALGVDLVCCLTENLIAFEINGSSHFNFFCADIDKSCFAISTYNLSKYAQKANTNRPKSILFLTLGMLVAMESKWTIDYHDEIEGCLFDKCIEHSSIVAGLSKMKFVHPACRRKIQNPIQLKTIDKLLALDLSFIFEYETVQVDFKGIVTNKYTKQAKQYIENLGNGVQLEMVEIPGGSFMMGTSPDDIEKVVAEYKRSYSDKEEDARRWVGWETPQHKVTVPSFYMGKYQVTQAQWRAIMGNNPSRFKGNDKLPVENMSWEDSIEFCKKLSEKTGKEYRLPSEAEWEYACRAGTTTAFAFGETITPEIVNYDGNYSYGEAAKGEYRQKTIPVGSLGVANEFGLYDMHGNVWEWCQDTWHSDYTDAPVDGSAQEKQPSNNTSRLLRGGSFSSYAIYCRSALRRRIAPDSRSNTYGFRVVMSARTLK